MAYFLFLVVFTSNAVASRMKVVFSLLLDMFTTYGAKDISVSDIAACSQWSHQHSSYLHLNYASLPFVFLFLLLLFTLSPLLFSYIV